MGLATTPKKGKIVTTRGKIATVVTACVLVGLSPSAHADDTAELTPKEASSEVAAALVDAGVPASTGAAPVADTGAGVSTTIPGASIAMSLPGADVTGRTSSSTVTDGPGESQAVVQNVGSDGKRVAFVVNSESDPVSYTLNLNGASSLAATEDGGLVALDTNGDVQVVLAPPWAKDASGADVPTHYEISGTSVIQVVEHRNGNFEYPISADPWAVRWNGITLYLNRNQTNNVGFGATGAAVAALAIPDPTLSKVLAGALTIFSGYANWLYNRGQCLAFTRTWWGQTTAWGYRGGSCR